MNLIENKYIKKSVAKLLVKDDWTMEGLSTAVPSALSKYQGVGPKTAINIIIEARRLVNQWKLNEAALHQPSVIEETALEEQPMSVRVRRLKEQNRE